MTHPSISQDLIDELSLHQEADDLIFHVFKLFGDRAIIGTSGQLTGVVMIDMAYRKGIKPRVYTLDTLRLFPETYQLLDELEKKYSIKVERIHPNPLRLQQMIAQHGEYLFFDSKEKQEFCCHIRKVLPNQAILKTVDVWLSGLRSDQSEDRRKTKKFEIIEHPEDKHPLLKIAPLVDWNESQLIDYCKKNGAPINKLLEWNDKGWRYESLGCLICTTPIAPHESRRAGRWRWFNKDGQDKKECGIHLTINDKDE